MDRILARARASRRLAAGALTALMLFVVAGPTLCRAMMREELRSSPSTCCSEGAARAGRSSGGADSPAPCKSCPLHELAKQKFLSASAKWAPSQGPAVLAHPASGGWTASALDRRAEFANSFGARSPARPLRLLNSILRV